MQMQVGVDPDTSKQFPMGEVLFQKVGAVLESHVSVGMLREKIQKVNSDYALAISETDKVNTKRTLELHKEFVEYLIVFHGTDQMVIRSPWSSIQQTETGGNVMVSTYGETATAPVDVIASGGSGCFKFGVKDLSDAEIKKYAQFMVRTVFNNFMFRETTIEDKINRARATEPLWKSNDKLLQMWIDNVYLEDNHENGINMHFDGTFVATLMKFANDVNIILNLIRLVDLMPKDT